MKPHSISLRLLRRLSTGTIVIAGGWLSFVSASADDLVAIPLHPNGVYAAGENIQWQISDPAATEIDYNLKKNGAELIGSGTIPLVSGSGVLQTSLNEPGALLVELTVKEQDKVKKSLLGAVIDPFKIQPSSPRPADFDAFWQSKIEQLNKIPVNPVVESQDSGDATVDYLKVQLDNINGTHVYGQLARPKGNGKFPAMMIMEGAGVYGLPKSYVIGSAKDGWLVLNIMAHDLPFDQPPDFYKQIASTTLKNYFAIGNDDREKSYFLRMMLGCYRAADYLTSRPDWNGRVFLVTGVSQGGFQSLVTAALHPKVTAALVRVPAGSDNAGPSVGHAVSWPWFSQAKDNAAKVAKTSPYFDTVNFASRIKCPVLVALGLIDTTCPPVGILSTYNQIPGQKEVVFMVTSGHSGGGNALAAFWPRSQAWLEALKAGSPPPVAPASNRSPGISPPVAPPTNGNLAPPS